MTCGTFTIGAIAFLCGTAAPSDKTHSSITLLFPIATLFLSIAVVVIAWRQWRVARNKLRLDLFDRRYKVYEATVKFLRESVQDNAHIDLHLSVFNDETSNAEFLFDTDVVNHLEKIRQKGREQDAVWFSKSERITETTEAFAPYLGFANVKI